MARACVQRSLRWTLPMALASASLSACRGEGKWDLLASGGASAEDGLPSDAFADGCAASFDALELAFQSVELVDAEGGSGGGVDVPSLLDLTGTGPHTVGLIDVLEGDYDRLDIRLGTADLPAVRMQGVLTCATGTAYFDWSFAGPVRTACTGVEVGVDRKGETETLLQVQADTIFAPSSAEADPERQGRHLLGLDADHNGDLTLSELAVATGDSAGLAPGAVPTDLRTHVTERVYGMLQVDDGPTCSSRGPG